MIQARIDWFRVFADLATAGYSMRIVSVTLGIPYRTLHAWRGEENEPRHHEGEAVVSLWCAVLKLPRDRLPRAAEASLSAARAKA